MRHAKSAWDTDADSDFERPLAKRGRRDRLTMTGWLVEHELVPDLVVSSSAVRTRMTVAPIIERCGVEAVFDDDLYGASGRSWLDTLVGLFADSTRADALRRVLICGHNPGLDDLVAALCMEPLPLTASGKLMTTAAIAHLEFPAGWPTSVTNAAKLIQLVRPGDVANTSGE